MKHYLLKAGFGIMACLLVAGFASVPTVAQEKTSALEAYTKWRSKALGALPNGIETPHYSVAVVSQRTDVASALLDFVVVGQMPSYTLEIQPIKLQRMPDGKDSRVEVGELSTSSIKKPIGLVDASPNPIHESTMVVPASNMANAIEVKWTPEGVTDMSYTLVLPLEDTPSANVMGVVASCKSQTATVSNIRKVGFNVANSTCNCYVAEGYSVRCDTMVACCFTPCARFDFVNCTVTCCTKCSRFDCCDGILPP